MQEKKISILLVMIVLLSTVGCASTSKEDTGSLANEKTMMKLVSFEENEELVKMVDAYNQSSTEYQITIEVYEHSQNVEDDGISRLQREIMSEGGPDLINFGDMYTTGDIAGEYTEDLSGYLGEDRDSQYFMNILEAFYYKDKLYALPTGFYLETFAGVKETLGNRQHWTIQEMVNCYNEKDDMMLYLGEFKKDVLASILTGSMEYYIDWETGTCDFDGEDFKKVLAFANSFPQELDFDEETSSKELYLNGKALLLPLKITNVYSLCNTEYIFGNHEISYIGFPTDSDNGTVIKPSSCSLAISMGSKHKEAAWDFISGLLTLEAQSNLEDSLPILRNGLEEMISENEEQLYIEDSEGNMILQERSCVSMEGEEPIPLYNITEKQGEELLKLVETASKSGANDYQLYMMLLEEADSYFSGFKTLDEVIEIMQNRATIYVNERIS